jgi:hypothetical protein
MIGFWEWNLCNRCGRQFNIGLVEKVKADRLYTNFCDHCQCGVYSCYGWVSLSESNFITILGEE